MKVKVKVVLRDHMNLQGDDPHLGPILVSLRDLTLQVSGRCEFLSDSVAIFFGSHQTLILAELFKLYVKNSPRAKVRK